MKCPACGKRSIDGKKFCPACGYQLRERRRDPAKSGVYAAAILSLGTFFMLIVGAGLDPMVYASDLEEVAWSITGYGLLLLPAIPALWILGAGSLRASFATWPHWTQLGFGLLGGLLSFAISAAYMLALFSIFDWEEDNSELEATTYWVAFVSWVILPALCEEWIDRGVLWVAMKRIAGDGTTIFTTALMFGMSHGLGEGSFLEVPHRFAVGLILGWLRARSGSLLPCILAHGVLNALALSL